MPLTAALATVVEALLHDTFGTRPVCMYNGAYSRGLRFEDIVRGQGVACNRGETKFLVELVDAESFSLQCVRPL